MVSFALPKRLLLSVTASMMIVLLVSCAAENSKIENGSSSQSGGSPDQQSVIASGNYLSDGEAVLVQQNFKMSDRQIDRTGAFIPQNGLPTLVFNSAVG